MYQCVLVLALPLRLLWPLTAPALGVRMSSERVVPAHIVHLNHHTLLRAYQLVPDEELSTEEEVEEEDHLKPSVNNPEAHRVEIEQPLKVLNTTNEYLNLMTAILNASPRSRRVSSSSFSSSSSSSLLLPLLLFLFLLLLLLLPPASSSSSFLFPPPPPPLPPLPPFACPPTGVSRASLASFPRQLSTEASSASFPWELPTVALGDGPPHPARAGKILEKEEPTTLPVRGVVLY